MKLQRIRVNMERDELQCGGRSPECVGMSLDVKLAFSRVCTLIDSLKEDIGVERASYQLLRIRNDITKVLKRKKDRKLPKENGFHNVTEFDTTNASACSLKGNQIQLSDSQSNLSARKVCLQPCSGNISFLSSREETGNGISFSNNLEENSRDTSKYCIQNGNTSFFNSKNKKLCASFSSSFRPMCNKTMEDPHKSVQLGTIMEEERFEIDVEIENDDDSEVQDNEESNAENPFFFLKAWSILKKNDDLLLTGIKMDEKGEILEKDFISKKVICRKEKDTVKTLDGEFVLQGFLTDSNKLIPVEVKNHFTEEVLFPRIWRKVLQQWINLDKKKSKEYNARKRSMSPKKIITLDKSKSIKVGQHIKGKLAGKQLKETEIPNKVKKNKQMKGKSPSFKKNESGPKITEMPGVNKNKKTNNRNPTINNTEKNCMIDSQISIKSKKINKKKEVNRLVSKKKKGPVTVSEGKDKYENKNLESGQEDNCGPFSELLEDESLFLLPKSSLTPNGLLGSIKKNVIKGRYTPPTSMFDNVYGNKSDNNSSMNNSFDDIVVKNNHVVKRMCKFNNKINSRKNNKSQKLILEENEAINEILRAAKAKTNTTPSIMKEVFSAEKAEDFSDLSDPD